MVVVGHWSIVARDGTGAGSAEGSPANRKRLSDLKLPRHCVIVALERAGEVMVPGGDTIVESGDVMLIITEPGATPELKTQLVGAGSR